MLTPTYIKNVVPMSEEILINVTPQGEAQPGRAGGSAVPECRARDGWQG
jgi:hypothetical protein